MSLIEWLTKERTNLESVRIGYKRRGILQEDEEFKSQVLDAISIIPDDHLRRLRGIYRMQESRAYYYDHSSQAMGRRDGWHNFFFDTVHLIGFDKSVLYHEIGHHVYHLYMPPDNLIEINDLFNTNDDIFSPYSERPTEIFARLYDRLASSTLVHGKEFPRSPEQIASAMRKSIDDAGIPFR